MYWNFWLWPKSNVFGRVFILGTVTNMKVIKTDTSFWLFIMIFIGIVTFVMITIVFALAWVYISLLVSIYINIIGPNNKNTRYLASKSSLKSSSMRKLKVFLKGVSWGVADLAFKLDLTVLINYKKMRSFLVFPNSLDSLDFLFLKK